MRGIALGVMCTIVAAASLLTATSAARPPDRPKVEPWLGACAKNVRPKRLRCARLEVPLERADPSLGTIPITYAIRPRSDRSRPSLGPIFAAEGGPGYGSIASARYYIRAFGPLLRRRELVVVDMRGTGHSRAIDCPALQRGHGSDRHGVAECARQLGPTYGSYRTSAAADDIDAVRVALGFDRITLYGDSYGTFLAQSYAYRHADRLDALVLDGAYPVRGESPWYPSLWRTGIRGLRIACERRRRCDGNAAHRLRRMVALLRETPRGVGPLLDAISAAGYEPPIRNYLRIDHAIERYLGGHKRAYRRVAAPYEGGFGPARTYSRGDELAVSCNDYPMLWDKSASERRREAQLAAAVRAHPSGAFAPFTPSEVALSAQAGYLECLGWPRPSPFYEPPAPPGADAPRVPTLVVAGELDDVTSAGEARLVAADFPLSRLMIVRNAGHVPTLYGGRYPARDRMRRFIVRHG